MSETFILVISWQTPQETYQARTDHVTVKSDICDYISFFIYPSSLHRFFSLHQKLFIAQF